MIAGAFGKVVDALVKNIIMQAVAAAANLLGADQGSYTGWVIPAGTSPSGVPVNIQIGTFLGEFVNFLIVSFAVFLFMVKFLGWITRRRAEAPARPTKEQELLTEIRDLLRTQHVGRTGGA